MLDTALGVAPMPRSRLFEPEPIIVLDLNQPSSIPFDQPDEQIVRPDIRFRHI